MRLLIICLLLFSTAAYAQRRKKSDSGAIAIGPYYPEENKYAPKAKRGKSKGAITRNSLENYKAQRKFVNKQKRKAERILEGPNYGTVNYFGHKREPVKSKPGKTKYCKECQIWH